MGGRQGGRERVREVFQTNCGFWLAAAALGVAAAAAVT